MSADTVHIRIHVTGTVLSPAQKIGGSYLYTMRAASEHVATGAVQAFLYCYVCNFRNGHHPPINRVRDSAPDGSSPRDCTILFKQWRIISKVLLFTLYSCERIFLATLPMGVLFVIEAFIDYL